VTTESTDFATFCHISEYWPDGYRQLDLMLASSYPLYLWAPSAVGIRQYSNIPAGDFLDYVRNGFIRICGRRDWLTNPASRAKSRWEGAPWDDEIDGEIKRFCDQEEQNGTPQPQRSVMIADDEDGWQWAEDYLARFPDEVARWSKYFRQAKASDFIPAGVLDTANRAVGNPRTDDIGRPKEYRIAKAIMRDARNHSVALVFSTAEAPFFLNRSNARFYRLLMRTVDDHADPAWTAPRQPRAVAWNSDTFVHDVLELMARLDGLAGPHTLRSFIGNPAHRQLTRWLADVCHELRRTEAERPDGELVHRLHEELQRGTFEKPIRKALAAPKSTAAALTASIMSTIDLLHDGAGVIGYAGYGLSVLLGGYAALQQLGLAASKYSGPQWPFIRAYGTSPTPELVRHLRHALER
jgi:hypothetical protein